MTYEYVCRYFAEIASYSVLFDFFPVGLVVDTYWFEAELEGAV